MADVEEDEKFIYFKDKSGNELIKISKYYISIQSDKFNGDNMVGIIIYQYDGKTEWVINNRIYRAPFIYLCNSHKLKQIKSEPLDTWHERCYKKLFGINPDYRKIVGGGFAFKDNEWKFHSGTFSAPDKNKQRNIKIAKYYQMEEFKDNWHNANREMTEIEQKYLKLAIDFWIKSDFKKLTYLAKGGVIWSWWNGKWINYDKETNQYIEDQYTRYLQENNINENDTYCIDLDKGDFKRKIKLKNKYKLYFSAPNISVHRSKIQSRNNVKWINDTDNNNEYFLQENHLIKRYRIVRRRNIIC